MFIRKLYSSLNCRLRHTGTAFYRESVNLVRAQHSFEYPPPTSPCPHYIYGICNTTYSMTVSTIIQ